MKALTVWDPYAAAIALGWKPIENRKVRIAHRGTLAITSAKVVPEQAAVDDALTRAMRAAPFVRSIDFARRRGELELELRRAFRPGHVVAVVDLVGVVTDATVLSPTEVAWTEPGRKWWRLENARRLVRPVPCRGLQGVWDLPADVEQLVREQLA